MALKDRYFSLEFLISLFLLGLTLLLFTRFAQFVESREGVQFKDPFLESFTAINLTKIIFSFIYAGIFMAILLLISFPHKLMILFEAYTLMVLTRILMMYCLPLAPPEGIILLKDPFVEFFGTGKTLVNDLFFSGHTATLFLLFFTSPKKFKWFFLVDAVFVASCVLLQKVHYTVDVLVAPFISYCCYQLILNFHNRRYVKRGKISSLYLSVN
jgi:PAP2 superfamily C-terminal